MPATNFQIQNRHSQSNYPATFGTAQPFSPMIVEKKNLFRFRANLFLGTCTSKCTANCGVNYSMIQLKGKAALITGGSAGLGASVARQLAAEGVNIVINYSNSKDRAEKLASEIKEDYKVKVYTVQADVFGGSDSAAKLVEDSVEKLGRLDIVISNAGWTQIVPFDDLEALDDELWDGCFNSNIKTHFYLFRAAKKVFDKNEEGGTFIVSASIAGRIAYGSSIPYAVSKAGLIHLVKILAKSQGPHVRVHAICPGLLLTEWGHRFPQAKIDHSIDSSPINKLADVDETAAHFVFLSKMATSTGTIVGVDGGLSLG